MSAIETVGLVRPADVQVSSGRQLQVALWREGKPLAKPLDVVTLQVGHPGSSVVTTTEPGWQMRSRIASGSGLDSVAQTIFTYPIWEGRTPPHSVTLNFSDERGEKWCGAHVLRYVDLTELMVTGIAGSVIGEPEKVVAAIYSVARTFEKLSRPEFAAMYSVAETKRGLFSKVGGHYSLSRIIWALTSKVGGLYSASRTAESLNPFMSAAFAELVTGTGGFTFNHGSGHGFNSLPAGSLLGAYLSFRGDLSITAFPADWVEVFTSPVGSTTQSRHALYVRRKPVGNLPNSSAFTVSASAQRRGVMFAITGAGDIVKVAQAGPTTGLGLAAPSLDVDEENEMLLSFFSAWAQANTITSEPAGMNRFWRAPANGVNTGTAQQQIASVYSERRTATGATGARSSGSSNNAGWVAANVIVKRRTLPPPPDPSYQRLGIISNQSYLGGITLTVPNYVRAGDLMILWQSGARVADVLLEDPYGGPGTGGPWPVVDYSSHVGPTIAYRGTTVLRARVATEYDAGAFMNVRIGAANDGSIAFDAAHLVVYRNAELVRGVTSASSWGNVPGQDGYLVHPGILAPAGSTVIGFAWPTEINADALVLNVPPEMVEFHARHGSGSSNLPGTTKASEEYRSVTGNTGSRTWHLQRLNSNTMTTALLSALVVVRPKT